MNKFFKFFGILLLLTVVFFMVHQQLLFGMGVDHFWHETTYSLLGFYGFGAGASLLLMALLFGAAHALPKQLGFVFLGAITLKLLASYLYVREGLGLFENDFLEYNFLVSFFLFLFFDVFVAFKLITQVDIKD